VPIATGPVHHLRLTVADVGRSRAFYEEVLGFRFVMDLPAGGSQVAESRIVVRPTSQVTLICHNNPGSEPFVPGEGD